MPIFQQRNAISRAAVGDAVIPSRGDAWARIVASLEPRPGELVVNKTTYGPFNPNRRISGTRKLRGT